MAQTLGSNKTRLANELVANEILSLTENVKTNYLIEENDNFAEVLQQNVKEEIAAQSLILSSKREFSLHNSLKIYNQDEQNKNFQNISLLNSSVINNIPKIVSLQYEHNYDASRDNIHSLDNINCAVSSNRSNTKDFNLQHKDQNEIESINSKEPLNQLDASNATNSIPFETRVAHNVLVSINSTVNSSDASDDSQQTDILMTEVELQPSLELSKYPQLFVCTTAQEAHELVKQYAEETLSTFVSMRKMKQYGITEGGIDMGRKNYRVFFESPDVQFDGVPYVYVADKMYICHLGKDKTEVTRQKIRLQSMEKRIKMGLPIKEVPATRLRTKKIDCPVKITVKMIAKFPQFKVPRKTKRVCETASKKVRQTLLETNGKVSCYFAFIGRLPGLNEHNHGVGEENADHEPIDPLIKDKIIRLTWEGNTNLNDIKKQLDDYVEKDLFSGKILPSKNRRRYYPSTKDIRNYMNKAKMLTRLSSEIREELNVLAIKLQQSRPTENIIIQSEYVDSKDPSAILKEDHSPKTTLIFCHQTPQQQRILKRYGSKVILCEITNSVQHVPFPMFCLFVQTNVDHQLVATFILEIRNKESIIQGLNTVKEWNPGWMPKYVTIDYAEEQTDAIQNVFPACGLFISDSSRQRNWHEWLNKSDYAVQGDLGILFEHFQSIANAYNEEVLHEAALQLENSEVWRGCANLRSWFNSKWLLEAKKWIMGYRPEDFMTAIHTESTIEMDVKLLKEAHINLMRGKKLGSLIEKLVDRIIPDFYRRYVELNRKSYTQANELKVLYGDQLPTCLVDKPASVILHVLDQIKSNDSAIYQVSHVQPGLFWVQDTSGAENNQSYTVSFGDASNLPSCNCVSWQQYKLPCKHLCSVFNSFPDWGWDMLDVCYTSNPLINLDYSCIKPWVDAHGKLGIHQIATTSTPVKTLNIIIKNQSKSHPQKEITQPANHYNSISETELKKQHSFKTQLSDVNESDEQRKDLVLRCEDLLKSITTYSKEDKHDHLNKLKFDLQVSIKLLKKSTAKRYAEECNDINSKKLKVDGSIIDDSSEENSYISDEEIIGFQISEEKETELCNDVLKDDLNDSTDLLEDHITSHLQSDKVCS
ncbi:uncharacterized protein LOC101236525 isoform X1 [Hydra vulgaris]|uniref:uncharacterized protein LOC101236525 isoform X1 n=1 Tax=Hydra vulgaris TaxID=6087 RepID=UPI001F5E43B7|nr:uncharacterized protein LOC101236525 [Hydra vulgaris]